MTEYIAVISDDVPASTEQRYLRLPHPRTGQPQLYLPYAGERDGLCEVVKVTGARGRTWFVDDKVSQGSILVHHPIDPVFLAIPIALSLIPDSRAAPFQPLADLLATAASSEAWALRPAFAPNAAAETWNPNMARLVDLPAFKRAFRACCDRKLVDAAPPSPPPEGGDADADGPEKASIAYYRPSRDAVLAILRAKVDRLAAKENFNKFDHLLRALGRDGLLEPTADSALVQAARTQAAIDHIAHYLPPALLPSLTGCYDMLALDTYLADRAASARAAAAPVVAGKKEKGGAAEAKRKAKSEASRGVEALKKVNTSGMAKMTSFFKPKAA